MNSSGRHLRISFGRAAGFLACTRRPTRSISGRNIRRSLAATSTSIPGIRRWSSEVAERDDPLVAFLGQTIADGPRSELASPLLLGDRGQASAYLPASPSSGFLVVNACSVLDQRALHAQRSIPCQGTAPKPLHLAGSVREFRIDRVLFVSAVILALHRCVGHCHRCRRSVTLQLKIDHEFVDRIRVFTAINIFHRDDPAFHKAARERGAPHRGLELRSRRRRHRYDRRARPALFSWSLVSLPPA